MKINLKVILPIVFCLMLGLVLVIPQGVQCDFGNLTLPDNMTPLHWEKRWKVLPPVLPREGARDALEVIYENKDETAIHIIYLYENALIAFLLLRINNEVFFPSSGWTWSELKGSEDWLLHSDEERIRCGISNDSVLGDKCDAVLRYDQYISEFSSPIGKDGMSQDEFKTVVYAIDERIATCLHREKHYK